jgi:hypothetical protein
MRFRATVLAGLLGVPLSVGAALAAETGNLSLVDAAKLGDREAVRSLLASRTKKEFAGLEGTAALIWAVTRNDMAMADLLLRAGANVKAANEYGATALYAAAANADPAMTVKLLAAGADANSHLLSGETPLMEAAHRGNLAGSQRRTNRLDVGGLGAPLRGYGGTGAARRRHWRPLETGVHPVDVCRPAG